MNQAIKIVQDNQQVENSKQIEELQNRLKELKKKNKAIQFKVVEFKHKKTGETMRGIEVHGITAKPMFLYGSQALALVQVANELREFVEQQRTNLSWKE